MAKSLVAVFVLLCTLSGILTCPQLQACTTNLTNITTDISALIPFCLNIVSKDGTLQACEQKAQRDCNLSGHEASYKTFKQEKFKARQECLRDCPKMNQVKTCFGLIQYDIIQTSGYSEFCRQYQNITTTCVDTKLSNCTFRKQLFESGLSSDGKRIVQNICNSGCFSIDETINSIQSCNKQFPIKAVDSRIDCQSYQKYKNCIQKLSPCSQFLVVAEYFTQNVTTAMTKCEQTTTSTAATTLTTTTQTTTGPVRWNTTNAPERHDVTCSMDSMSVFVPMSVLSSQDSLTWRDPHCQVSSNGTHFESTILHSACGTTVLFTNDEIIFENELLIHQQGLQNVIPLNGSVQIDFGQKNYDIIPVRCVYLRNMNVTTSYRPAQSHIRFYEKRYGHLDVVLEQFKSDQFVTALPVRSYPMEVELNKDIFFKLRASHVNSSDIALKVDSCIATPSLFPASSQTYELLKQGCPSSPAVKLFPSSYEEVRFGVRAFEFSQSPGGVVYIHCQVSLCSSASPQCVTGCSSRHRREAVGSEGPSQLISGGPYLVVADEGSIQASTIVAAVCACIAVVSTVFAVIGWRRKLERSAA